MRRCRALVTSRVASTTRDLLVRRVAVPAAKPVLQATRSALARSFSASSSGGSSESKADSSEEDKVADPDALYRNALMLREHIGFDETGGKGALQLINKAAALQLMRRAAEAGHVQAQFKTALWFGEEGNWNGAAWYYRMAALQGSSEAMTQLGVCWAEGKGVKQDFNAALEFWRKAIAINPKAGHALFNLARCYAQGLGVERDAAQEVAFLRRAIDAGNANAMGALSGHMYRGTAGVAQDVKEGFRLALAGADAGDEHCEWLVGMAYSRGNGVAKDAAKAVSYLQKSSAAGHPPGVHFLGEHLLLGKGVPRDYAAAVDCFRRGAAGGVTESFRQLGDCHRYGWGVQRDEKEAASWYAKGAAAGCEESKVALAELKKEGT